MNYKIKITKTEANPNYKDEMAAYKEERKYFNRGYEQDRGEPLAEFVKDVLICELSEEQYKKVKAEVMRTFE